MRPAQGPRKSKCQHPQTGQVLWGPTEIPVPGVNCVRELMPLKKHSIDVDCCEHVSIVPGCACTSSVVRICMSHAFKKVLMGFQEATCPDPRLTQLLLCPSLPDLHSIVTKPQVPFLGCRTHLFFFPQKVLVFLFL